VQSASIVTIFVLLLPMSCVCIRPECTVRVKNPFSKSREKWFSFSENSHCTCHFHLKRVTPYFITF